MQLLTTLLTHNPQPGHRQRGQATVEYVLVTLAAAMIAGLFIKFLGGAGAISSIFAKVISMILDLF